MNCTLGSILLTAALFSATNYSYISHIYFIYLQNLLHSTGKSPQSYTPLWGAPNMQNICKIVCVNLLFLHISKSVCVKCSAEQISCVIVDWICSEVTDILKGL